MSITSQGRADRLSSAARSRTSADGGVSRVLRALVSLFRRPPQPTALEYAEHARMNAAARYMRAKLSGDTRRTHHALKRLERATREVLHQERLAGVR